MAELYTRGFSYSDGDLGVKLADFDHRVSDYVQHLKASAATEAGERLYDEAPWKNRSWKAREGLWAKPYGDAARGGIRMGHSVEYGIYLEKYHGGRFQIIMPVLVSTGKAFMRSLEHMFAQLEAHAPAVVADVPTTGRQGTSQNLGTVVKRKAVARYRDVKGRFVKLPGTTATTKRTRRR